MASDGFKLTRRAALFGGGAAVGAGAWSLVRSDLPVLTGTASLATASDDGYLNDISGLSRTPVASHRVLEVASQPNLVASLREELRVAGLDGQPIAVGAARHSMGGHSLPRNGRAITLRHDWLSADAAAGTYRVAAGARWADVIRQLDAIGFSPKVMQSNNDFGVASTFSVNAHGWPVPFGPFGSTVRQIRLLTAGGEHVTCSRSENAELFRLAMGGYGLFGIVTELEMEMVRNDRLEPSFHRMPAMDFAAAFVSALSGDPAVRMAYGRLNVDRGGFFSQAMLITYRPAGDQADIPPARGAGFVSRMSRHVFRAQLGNEVAKQLRWGVETRFAGTISAAATRNSLLNEPVVALDDGDPDRTDILHEYFVPPERFPVFIEACRNIIPASYQELLNVTLRYVAADRESVLSYAPEPRIAAVMLFSQEMTTRAEADMRRMTRALIDRVVAIGGTYYLPYRPHATVDQFVRAYPRSPEFAAAKRLHDPALSFRNNFWDAYLSGL